MTLLDKDDAAIVREELDGLSHDVRLLFFTQEFECAYCRETHELLEELASLSDRLEVEVLDFQEDAEQAEDFGVDKIPAILPLRATADGESLQDYGIRFYGVPGGYEFTSLLEAIKLVGGGELLLSEKSVSQLQELNQPLHIQVFVTPTCPYCTQAVVLAHQIAFVSPLVTADMVEATEFPHLANQYRVMGVPRTVVNEELHIEGAVPEPMLIAKLPLEG